MERATQTPVLFDPAQQGRFNLDAPPAPWIDLGWIQSFARKATSKSTPILTGIPAAVQQQVRQTLEAQLTVQFLSWTKLSMSLATGSQHMNVLATESDGACAPMGAQAAAAVVIQNGSSASTILLAPADAAKFPAGSIVAVDVDYTGQTGFVGSPVSGTYVRQPLTDVDYIRRVTFNVALVTQATSSGLMLASPLIGGAPAAGAKLQAVTGFVDREGGCFYQEWSALFVTEGSQNERIFYHYPRLQAICGAEEAVTALDAKNKNGQSRVQLVGQFLALPVIDPMDGERVVCYRSFLPASKAIV
ncbi:MAG TPA: hypothetical protein VF730_13600 [Terracidiphilus sp.]